MNSSYFYFKYYINRACDDKRGMSDSVELAYTRLVDYQYTHDRFTVDEARKVIGHRFYRIWPELLKVLDCVDEKYFIPWVDDVIYDIQDRKAKRSERSTEAWKIRNQIKDVKKRLRL